MRSGVKEGFPCFRAKDVVGTLLKNILQLLAHFCHFQTRLTRSSRFGAAHLSHLNRG